MIFLSGANINLRHSSITLGPDQLADVKCLQKFLGSQTTPIWVINSIQVFLGGGGEKGPRIDLWKYYLHFIIRKSRG